MAIIGILASLGAYTYAAALARSRDSQRIADMEFIGNGLEQFYLDNRSYPQVVNNPHSLFMAKWQLEDIGGIDCPPPGNKLFLAPKYLTTIPEDPKYKLTVVGGCIDNNFGQYIYTITGSSTQFPRSYYLMARMERTINMSSTNPIPENGDLDPYRNEFRAGGDPNFILCNAGNFTEICSHNYYLSNKND